MLLISFFKVSQTFSSISVILAFITYWTSLRKVQGVPSIITSFACMSYALTLALFFLVMTFETHLAEMDKIFYVFGIIVDTLAVVVAFMVYDNLDILYDTDRHKHWCI